MDSTESLFLAATTEQSKTRRERKNFGVFYTPENLACAIAERLLDDENFTCLDPACGGGSLLLAVFSTALKKFPTLSPEKILSEQLFGFDIDEAAIIRCRATLLSAYRTYTGNDPSPTLMTQLTKNISLQDGLLSQEQKKFSCIIANPPYGLSRDKEYDSEYFPTLQKKFADAVTGKPNLAAFFIAQGIELLEPKGRFAFIVPNSFCGISSHKKLRHTLLSKKILTEVSITDSSTFNAGVEAVVFWKLTPSDSVTISTFVNNSFIEKKSVPYLELLLDTEVKFPLSEDSQSFATLPKLLSLQVKPFCGLQAYRTGGGTPPQTKETLETKPFSSRAPLDNSYRYLKGGDIGRYSLSWSGEYLQHGEFLAECPPLSYYSGGRILVREILGKTPRRIQATYTTETFLHNRSILGIIPIKNCSDELLYAILGILNSKFGDSVLAQCGRKSERKLFPKLVLADLKTFPMPHVMPLSELSSLVRQRLQGDLNVEEPIDTIVESAYTAL